jgi:serine protease AprX
MQSYKTDPLDQAVEAAWKAGIVVVVAAGNDGRDNSHGHQGYGTITAPGNDPYVITVGAPATTTEITTARRHHDHLQLQGTHRDRSHREAGPGGAGQSGGLGTIHGVMLVTVSANQIPTDDYNPAGSSAYSPYFFTLSGTSMATPVVSGAARC